MLMTFYQQGRNERKFRSPASRRLCSASWPIPSLYFRKEAEPANLAAGQTYHISDLELASRLSFFLWSSIPDDELIDVAAQNKLHEPAVLDQQVQRMLADPRADRLVINFAGQWLNLRALQTWAPTVAHVPGFRRQSAAGDAQGNRAVRRQHRARGSQRDRSAGRATTPS